MKKVEMEDDTWRWDLDWSAKIMVNLNPISLQCCFNDNTAPQKILENVKDSRVNNPPSILTWDRYQESAYVYFGYVMGRGIFGLWHRTRGPCKPRSDNVQTIYCDSRPRKPPLSFTCLLTCGISMDFGFSWPMMLYSSVFHLTLLGPGQRSGPLIDRTNLIWADGKPHDGEVQPSPRYRISGVVAKDTYKPRYWP